jgi:aconitate hydratase
VESTRRQDGNEGTHSFVTSPELATAFAFSGSLQFNPITDSLSDSEGARFRFQPPFGEELPKEFSSPMGPEVYQAPLPIAEASSMPIKIQQESDRLQLLEDFPAWDEKKARDLVILVKVKGKCTTDHISPAGPWYDYRGHLDNISWNLLTGAENAFLPDYRRGTAQSALTRAIDSTPVIARSYKDAGIPWCIVGNNNYGEGSSREHAALEPRHLGCTVIIANSFARIHETNLKKQGILAVTFADQSAYEKIETGDKISVLGTLELEEGKQLTMKVWRTDGSSWETMLNHAYSKEQVPWLMAGSALNHVKATRRFQ